MTEPPRLDSTTYDLLMDASGAIYGAMAEARRRAELPAPPPILLLRGGLAESPGWFLIQAAEFDPEPLTVENLRVRDTYASERVVAALLELLATEGWLERDGAGAYALTEAGRATVGAILGRRRSLLADAALLPADEAGRLHALLSRLIDASLAAPEPPGTWCLAHSRRRAPQADAPILTRMLQLFEDFNAFRDDAHMAAWQPLGVAGHVWEAFALLAAGAAADAEAIAAQLRHRGYSPGEYAAALEDLAGRGWIAPGDPPAYALTEAGRAVRGEVERATDALFYAPWGALAPGELAELHGLLLRLRGGGAA